MFFYLFLSKCGRIIKTQQEMSSHKSVTSSQSVTSLSINYSPALSTSLIHEQSWAEQHTYS